MKLVRIYAVVAVPDYMRDEDVEEEVSIMEYDDDVAIQFLRAVEGYDGEMLEHGADPSSWDVGPGAAS